MGLQPILSLGSRPEQNRSVSVPDKPTIHSCRQANQVFLLQCVKYESLVMSDELMKKQRLKLLFIFFSADGSV